MRNNERNDIGESRKKDSKALWFLYNFVEDPIFPKIAVATKAHQDWEILEIVYQGTSKVKNAKLQTLRRNFETLVMKNI